MWKGFIKHCAIGAIVGMNMDYLAAIALSYILRLGYFAPCFALLPERVGGEINAVVFQLALCALLGAGIGAGVCIFRLHKGRLLRKLLLTAASIIGFLMPAAALSIGMLK